MRSVTRIAIALTVTSLLACGGGEGAANGATEASAEDVPGEVLPPADASPQADTADAQADQQAGPTCPPPPTLAFPWAGEATDDTCADGVDQDGNGYTDCDDFGCARNLAVTVCGDKARFENDPASCGNQQDDDGDGLTDCEDPDCSKNPFHGACEHPPRECDCLGDADADGDGLAGCADPDCVAAQPACVPPAGVPRAWAPVPWPPQPTKEDDWAGALSSFGFALTQAGFQVESLPAWGRLSLGDDTNAQDLSRYQVLVLMEPSRALTAGEKEAIVRFVQAGGGLLAVANHVGADRDGNGVSAPIALNGLLADNPVQADPFGLALDEVDVDVSKPLDRIALPEHPVIQGPAGPVGRIGFYQGCSIHLTGTNPDARALIQFSDAPDDATRIAVAVAEVGPGRVVLAADSAIAGDGTDSHGNRNLDHDSWHSPSQDNAPFFLNAVHWLAGAAAPAE